LRKLRVERRLAAGEIDASDSGGFACFVDYAAKQFYRKKLGVVAVEIVFGTKAVAAVKIADVGELHTQTLRTVVVAEVVVGFHGY
jgi:hypothetical protein